MGCGGGGGLYSTYVAIRNGYKKNEAKTDLGNRHTY